MVISDILEYGNEKFNLEYHDADSFDDLPTDKCTQVYGICFWGDRLVIGYGGNKKDWGLIGGTIEVGESFRQTLEREIAEESNMKVIDAKPIGYQKVTDSKGQSIYQLRYWCKAEPIGDFVEDPAGGVTAIKIINPITYKEYFDWGQIGERLIFRGMQLNQK